MESANTRRQEYAFRVRVFVDCAAALAGVCMSLTIAGSTHLVRGYWWQTLLVMAAAGVSEVYVFAATVVNRGVKNMTQYTASAAIVALSICLMPFPLNAAALSAGALLGCVVSYRRVSLLFSQFPTVSLCMTAACAAAAMIDTSINMTPRLFMAALTSGILDDLLSLGVYALYIHTKDGTSARDVVRYGLRNALTFTLPITCIGACLGVMSIYPYTLLAGIGPIWVLILASRTNRTAFENRFYLDGLLGAAAAVNGTRDPATVQAAVLEAADALLRTSGSRFSPTLPADGELGVALTPPVPGCTYLIAGTRDGAHGIYDADDLSVLASLASIGASALSNAHAQLNADRRASQDALTGLPNRRAVIAALTLEIANVKRNAQGLAVLFIDLDGFKAVNDRFGHAVGDIVLAESAYRMTSVLRETDTAGRLGGDEFLLVLRNVNGTEDARQAADRINAAISGSMVLPEHGAVTVRASIGMAVWRPGLDTRSLIDLADAEMYRAKDHDSGWPKPVASDTDHATAARRPKTGTQDLVSQSE